MKPEGSLLSSQEPTISPYSETDATIPNFPVLVP